MGGKHSRTKGHSFERWVAAELRSVFPKARRQLEYHEDDCHGVDIAETGDFKFQCKKLKHYASVNTIREVKCDRSKEIPILVTAGDREEPMAILPFEDLVRLLNFVCGWK